MLVLGPGCVGSLERRAPANLMGCSRPKLRVEERGHPLAVLLLDGESPTLFLEDPTKLPSDSLLVFRTQLHAGQSTSTGGRRGEGTTFPGRLSKTRC
jgi:hypothetical protein